MSTILQSSRREALFTAGFWIAACAYTVGYAALFAYRQESPPSLLWGMPTWVVWGVMLPWVTCTLVTCWYALCCIKDEDLGDEADPAASHSHVSPDPSHG